MKINKTRAIEFLVAMGFAKAINWEDKVLISRLGQIPSKIDEEEVPEGFEDLYEQLSNSAKDEAIVFEGDKKSKKKSAKKETQKELPLEAPPKKKSAKKKEAKPEPPAKKEKSKPAPAKAKKEKSKPAKEETKSADRDKYGSRVGTISAKVNAAITSEWKQGEEIAKELKISFTQARARLYHCNQEGIVECRRRVEYRLVRKKK
jgi:hypothetical protein